MSALCLTLWYGGIGRGGSMILTGVFLFDWCCDSFVYLFPW